MLSHIEQIYDIFNRHVAKYKKQFDSSSVEVIRKNYIRSFLVIHISYNYDNVEIHYYKGVRRYLGTISPFIDYSVKVNGKVIVDIDQN